MRSSLAVLLLACAVVAVGAQGPAANPPQRPTFRGGINYVRVDLYATRDGKPITDLTQDDLEIREDGAPQAIKDFEHVEVRRNTPEAVRIEPNTVAESRAMAGDARARVFVLFLDTYHITAEGLATMRTPLVRFIDRLMGPDDMVAVMTPEMGAFDITFSRKTTIIDSILQKEWGWARRERIEANDDKDRVYGLCYSEAVAQEMVARHREKMTLDALGDLVGFLQNVRDERKAIITISEGWRLYGRSPELLNVRTDAGATLQTPVGANRRRADNTRDTGTFAECEADRLVLAGLEDQEYLNDITQRANRSNATFYPVHPRGLVVFDESIGGSGSAYRSPIEDSARLSERLTSLRTLARDTDGTPIINTNDINGALSRIVDDLSSYYLLGYESTNNKLDGKFRSISVRVKRPGVQVRARKGYLSLRPEEVKTNATAPAASTSTRTAAAAPAPVTVDPRAAFRLRPAAWIPASGGPAVWIVGEMDFSTRRDPTWAGGATADITVTSASGVQVASLQVPVTAADGFSTKLPQTTALPAGQYSVRVRLTPKNGQALPLTDIARLLVTDAPMPLGQAMVYRRGPSTGTRYVATADPRFQRSDRLRLELPTRADGMPTAQLLDATGKPMPIQVALTERQDAAGFRWIVADAVLGPLAAGDYAVEVVLGDARQVTSFRVVP